MAEQADNTIWNYCDYHPHQQMDVTTHNENVEAQVELCPECDGTGNYLFSMYQKCPHCNGTGRKGEDNG